MMLTLPRSPADRTNNSLTHMQHDNIYKYTRLRESSRAAYGWPAPRPAQAQRAPLITIGPAGTVNILRQPRTCILQIYNHQVTWYLWIKDSQLMVVCTVQRSAFLLLQKGGSNSPGMRWTGPVTFVMCEVMWNVLLAN